METRSLYFLLFALLFGQLAPGQTCPQLISPANGEEDVPVDAAISWTDPGSFSGFIVSIGTTPGGVDILTNRTSSPISGYKPETGLPEDTWIYISFILILADGTEISCPGYRFRTAPFDRPPDCTRLLAPRNNAEEVALGEELIWDYAPRATGYLLTVLTSQGDTLVAERDMGNILDFNPPGNFPPETDIFVQITPYNRLGPAPGGCPAERFRTGASTVDCGPQRPEILGFPGAVGLCPELGYAEVSAPAGADGYNWFRVAADGSQQLVASGREVRLDVTGNYFLEAYNEVGSINEFAICNTLVEFSVVTTPPPMIRRTQVSREVDGLRIQVFLEQNGAYEYSLDPVSGFQSSPIFSGLPLQGYTVYVRDAFGCGQVQQEVARSLSAADFPPFFTPNNDGANDLWRFDPPQDLSDAYVETIRIFDRYGNFLIELDPESRGWDGNVNGKPVPASVYWFVAVSLRQEVIRGYFALKR
ncbi:MULTISPECIES: T9SS type B sorting domain-containing protein [unclassified Robiginitalea]|uniref:T9SS type B sorting domain-containing protein n=1 Tax=Robiginitalea TaxID=252306 RepID=UPI00234A7E44|nr:MULTISPECIES: T9SS type B sorting domain-containing protein [unclassified Robiginitalea]MDC6355251.1 T9SS type B sorting domain-containing protein [Robiginitalea sp. PM2]MDC6375534.1 T9SS type B sorting domain-containing protein [Robiginitalea sp. SP8]